MVSQQRPTETPEPTLFAGIDWATKTHVVSVMAPGGTPKGRLVFEHSPEGFAQLVGWLQQRCPDPSSIAVAIEDPHHPLVDWLLERGMQVFSLNPKQLDRFRDRHSVSGAKDDSRDSFVLADALRTDRHKFSRRSLPDCHQLAIREASRLYDTLEKDFSRAANRLQALLLRSAPNLLALCPAANEPFFFELLTLAPTSEAAQRLRTARIATLLKKHDKPSLQAEDVLATLRARRLPLAPGAQEAIWQTILTLLPVLTASSQQLRATRTRLSQLVRAGGRQAQILDSFPGVAEIIASTFLAEAPEALLKADLQHLRALAGTAPVTVRSGKSNSVRMRRACNRRLRDAAFLWAWNAAIRDPIAKAHYQELVARGHRRPRALRGVADGLLARLVAALKSDSLYAPPLPLQQTVAA